MRVRKTKIERLDAKHPGLEQDVCRWLKGHLTGREVSDRVREKYKKTVAPNTINSFRARRVDGELKAIQARKVEVVAIAQAVGEDGLDAGALAKLWEVLQRMTPTELIELRRLQVERARVQVLDKRADVDAQRAENQKQNLKAMFARLKGQQSAGAAGSAQPVDPAEIRRRIRAIYGLYDEDTCRGCGFRRDTCKCEKSGSAPDASTTGQPEASEAPGDQSRLDSAASAGTDAAHGSVRPDTDPDPR